MLFPHGGTVQHFTSYMQIAHSNLTVKFQNTDFKIKLNFIVWKSNKYFLKSADEFNINIHKSG